MLKTRNGAKIQSQQPEQPTSKTTRTFKDALQTAWIQAYAYSMLAGTTAIKTAKRTANFTKEAFRKSAETLEKHPRTSRIISAISTIPSTMGILQMREIIQAVESRTLPHNFYTYLQSLALLIESLPISITNMATLTATLTTEDLLKAMFAKKKPQPAEELAKEPTEIEEEKEQEQPNESAELEARQELDKPETEDSTFLRFMLFNAFSALVWGGTRFVQYLAILENAKLLQEQSTIPHMQGLVRIILSLPPLIHAINTAKIESENIMPESAEADSFTLTNLWRIGSAIMLIFYTLYIQYGPAIKEILRHLK